MASIRITIETDNAKVGKRKCVAFLRILAADLADTLPGLINVGQCIGRDYPLVGNADGKIEVVD